MVISKILDKLAIDNINKMNKYIYISYLIYSPGFEKWEKLKAGN